MQYLIASTTCENLGSTTDCTYAYSSTDDLQEFNISDFASLFFIWVVAFGVTLYLMRKFL